MFVVKESGWMFIILCNDCYVCEKMVVSLEFLCVFYLNKGYINFNINYLSLNLSEDKKNIFVEVLVDEGE